MQLNPMTVRAEVDALLAQCPELAEDEALRADMIEGETSLHEFLARVERSRQEATHLAGAIATNIADLETRQARFERREQSLRKLELTLLQVAGLKKLELAEATLSVSKPRGRVHVADETSVPDEYRQEPKPPKPDLTKIKQALESGAAFNWASIEHGEPTLTVRVR